MTQLKTHTRTTVDRCIHTIRRMAGVFAIAGRVSWRCVRTRTAQIARNDENRSRTGPATQG